MEWLKPVTAVLKPSSSSSSQAPLTLFSVPPPASGAVLAAILKIIDSFGPMDEDPVFYHRLVESFKWAYAARTNLGDPFDEEITDFIRFVEADPDLFRKGDDLFVREFVANMTSISWAEDKRDRIDDWKTYNDSDHYGADFYSPEDHGTSHISVVAPNGDAVAVTTTVNFYLGAEILSQSTGWS